MIRAPNWDGSTCQLARRLRAGAETADIRELSRAVRVKHQWRRFREARGLTLLQAQEWAQLHYSPPWTVRERWIAAIKGSARVAAFSGGAIISLWIIGEAMWATLSRLWST